MIGHTKLLTELARLAKRTRADGVSACAQAGSRRVFRFADNAIHQDLTQERVTVTVKVIRDGRIGVASADTLEPVSLTRCARSALEIAKHSPRQPQLPDLPSGHRIRTTADHVPETIRMSALGCVALLKRLFHLCQGLGVALAGSLVTGEDELAVLNSSGVACYTASTLAGVKLVTLYGKLAGYASAVHPDVRRLNVDEALKRSLAQSHHRRDPITLPLGTYEVILEPQAVADLMEWLGGIAFGAKSVEERTSFLAGRMGEEVMGRQITIYDDGNEPETLRLPFDFEGTPKRRVTLIDRGRAAGIVFDTVYGARFGQPSTGHAMPADEVDGPLPLHLGLAPGEVSVAEMLRRCRRGLLIPRFHYVNGLLQPRTALMTGLTREGTVLIEDGKLTTPSTTMRFTQSILDAFRHVLGVSKERRLVADPNTSLGCTLMPTLHLAQFRFTGHSGD